MVYLLEMKREFKILIALITLIGFVSCHKYPEDPFISFRRPTKRIEGTWNITSYQVYGVEHSHDFDSLLSPETLTDIGLKFSPYSFQGYPINGDFTFVGKNGNIPFTKNQFTFYDSQSLTFTYFKRNSTDTIFYNLFFFRTNNIPTRNTDGYETGTNYWSIVELYGHNFHISYNGIDIYLKKQWHLYTTSAD